MTEDALDTTHLPTPVEAEAIADEIVLQLTVAFDDDSRPTASTSVLLTRARWASVLAVLRERALDEGLKAEVSAPSAGCP